MSVLASDAILTCISLQKLIDEQNQLCDISKMSISVSRPNFKIIFVPKGCEQTAKMELNER